MEGLLNRGFTLIELLVVLLVIAILVSLAIPLTAHMKDNAIRRTCQANLRILDGSIQSYYVCEGDYPPLSDGDDAQLLSNYFVPTYLKSMPSCPAGGNYTYNEGYPPYVSCDSNVGGPHENP